MLKKDLKTYLRQYRPFFIFLIKFLLFYVVLTLLYQWYLSQYDQSAFETDGATVLVAEQSASFVEMLGYDVRLRPHPEQPSVMFILNDVYLARIVEGCNAISVMILFAAFVVSFKGRWKHTIVFIALGILLIHFLNIIRIGLLTMALLHYPEYGDFLHGVLFPLFIYGVVFLLWILWVNKFSIYGSASQK